MNGAWLPYATLRAASLLAPGDQRAEWLKEWQSELWYIPRREATRFCLGAFQDALWLRRNSVSPVQPIRFHLDSPLNCLIFLAALSAASLLIAVCLPAPQDLTASSHLRASDLPRGCLAMLLYTSLLLPTTRLTMGRAPAVCHLIRWPNRLRRWTFMAMKIALVQPMMLFGFVVLAAMGTVPLATLGVCASWILALRWVLIDQRRRCPVCLRSLGNPVRIGTPSQTFLEWYGAESICPRGHGLLQVPEISSSYSGRGQWLRLGRSWSSLFSPAAGARQ
ncbi:MAG: hypothetical protein ABSF54_21335 [Bryobacteraceae bacterium]|jgi:hypothetical protein